MKKLILSILLCICLSKSYAQTKDGIYNPITRDGVSYNIIEKRKNDILKKQEISYKIKNGLPWIISIASATGMAVYLISK